MQSSKTRDISVSISKIQNNRKKLVPEVANATERGKELDETGSQTLCHQFLQRPLAWGAICLVILG